MNTDKHNPKNPDAWTMTYPSTMEQAGRTSPHEEICAWLRANGLDPRVVCAEANASVSDGQLTLLCKVQHDGHDVLNPERTDVMRETVTLPVVVPPPPIVEIWLAPKCPTCGR